MPETRSQLLMKSNKLSDDLAAIVGKTVASRIELIELLWAYLKKNKLECEDNEDFFLPDEKMAKVFGPEKILGVSMANRIQAHLTPIDTINDSDDVCSIYRMKSDSYLNLKTFKMSKLDFQNLFQPIVS